jgi:hypothetical protein
MPNRWLAIGICAFWAVTMALLIERDVLPHWKLGHRPDFRAVSQVAPTPQPVRWSIWHSDQRVGWVQTLWMAKPDDSTVYRSEMELDQIPFISPIGNAPAGRLRCESTFHLAPDRNLSSFEILIFWDDPKPTVTVEGRLDGDIMKVQFRTGGLVHDDQFYYEPHSLMTSSLAPIDKLPNLAVGQKWQHRVMNPLWKTVDTVRCEVTSEQVITWRGDPTPTYLVEQRYGTLRARCWVAYDGTVLRQEIPLGVEPLVLEHD